MTKRDLVKWLEKRSSEAIVTARNDRDKMIERAKEVEYVAIGLDDFVKDTVDIFKKYLDRYGAFIANVNSIDGMSMSKYNWRFGYNDFVAKFSDAQTIRGNYKEAIHINTTRYKEIVDKANSDEAKVESTYYTVIETVKNLPTAKDGLEYLKKLGFDISEIEPAEKKKQLPATISVNVDVKYLLLNKEKEDAGTRQIDSTDK